MLGTRFGQSWNAASRAGGHFIAEPSPVPLLTGGHVTGKVVQLGEAFAGYEVAVSVQLGDVAIVAYLPFPKRPTTAGPQSPAYSGFHTIGG